MNPPNSLGWRVLRYLLAALLFFAAATKAVNVVQIVSSDGLLASRPLLLSAIAFEAAAATYLVVGSASLSWILAIGVFSTLTVAAAYATVANRDCNCFSKAAGTRVTLPLDVVILVLTGCLRPRGGFVGDSRLAVHVVCSALVGGMFAGAAVLQERSASSRSQSLEYITADLLVGKPWPLNSSLQQSLRPLDRGRWLVLIVRGDCEHCQELVAERFADPRAHRPNERTAVFIAGATTWPFQFDQVSLTVDAAGSIQWPGPEPFVASPAVFLLDDGIVQSAQDGAESSAFIAKLFQSPP